MLGSVTRTSLRCQYEAAHLVGSCSARRYFHCRSTSLSIRLPSPAKLAGASMALSAKAERSVEASSSKPSHRTRRPTSWAMSWTSLLRSSSSSRLIACSQL